MRRSSGRRRNGCRWSAGQGEILLDVGRTQPEPGGERAPAHAAVDRERPLRIAGDRGDEIALIEAGRVVVDPDGDHLERVDRVDRDARGVRAAGFPVEAIQRSPAENEMACAIGLVAVAFRFGGEAPSAREASTSRSTASRVAPTTRARPVGASPSTWTPPACGLGHPANHPRHQPGAYLVLQQRLCLSDAARGGRLGMANRQARPIGIRRIMKD